MKYDSLEKFIDGEKNKFNYFNEYIKEIIIQKSIVLEVLIYQVWNMVIKGMRQLDIY